jgi:hypothetical protein
MAEPTSIRYELSPDDIMGLSKFLDTPDGRRVMRMHYAPGAALGIVLAVLAAVITGVRQPLFVFVTLVLVAVPCTIAWRAYIRSYYLGPPNATRGSNRTGTGLGAHTMWIDENGIREAGPIREVQHRWSAVGGVYETPKLLILPVGLSGQYVVPKRAFSTEAEAEAFRVEALSRWQAARRWDGPSGAK